MTLLIDFSDIEIEREYHRRNAIRESLYRAKREERRIQSCTRIINDIHSIDSGVPIVLFDPSKGHSHWYIKNTHCTLHTFQYNFFRSWTLCRCVDMSKPIEEYSDLISKAFIDVYEMQRRGRADGDWFYFIKIFDYGIQSVYGEYGTAPIKVWFRVVSNSVLNK